MQHNGRTRSPGQFDHNLERRLYNHSTGSNTRMCVGVEPGSRLHPPIEESIATRGPQLSSTTSATSLTLELLRRESRHHKTASECLISSGMSSPNRCSGELELRRGPSANQYVRDVLVHAPTTLLGTEHRSAKRAFIPSTNLCVYPYNQDSTRRWVKGLNFDLFFEPK